MAITIKTELISSRDVVKTSDGYSEVDEYRVEGTNNPHEVISSLASLGFVIKGAHPVWGSLSILGSVNVIQHPELPVNSCLLTANYAPPVRGGGANYNQSDERWVFDMVARQVRINSVENEDQVIQFDSNGAITNADTSIGKNGNKVEGATVYRPFGAVQCTKRYENKSQVSQAFRQTLYSLEGTVNSGNFIDWQAGEVLFLGANINYPGDTSAEVTYRFLFTKDTGSQIISLLNEAGAGNAYVEVSIDPKPFDTVAFTLGERTNSNDLNKKLTGPTKVGVYTTYSEGNFANLNLVGP